MATTARKATAKKAASSTKQATPSAEQSTASDTGQSGQSEVKTGDGQDTLKHVGTGDVVPKDPNATPEVTSDQVQPDLKVQIIEPEPEPAAEVDRETVDKGFIHVHHLDPMRKLPGGTYLDEQQRYDAEVARAMVEDREPDLKTPPAVQGTPYRSLEQIESELPPHATLEAEVTLPVVVTKQ